MKKVLMKKILFRFYFSVAAIALFAGQGFAQCNVKIGKTGSLSGCTPLTIQFSDSTTGCVVFTRLWDFGDGGATSSVQNPSHTFTAGSNDTTYTVTFTVNGTTSATVNVNVYASPLTTFSMDFDSICALSPVCFTNNSASGPGYSYFWKFGDGVVYTGTDTCHIYGLEGNVTVNLTTTDDQGCSDEFSDTVVVNEVPNPQFTSDVSTGCLPFNVTFTNTTVPGTSPITNWLWDFGDGQTSTLQAPGSIGYVNPDTFLVTLTATNALGCSNNISSPIIANQTPTSTFLYETEVCINVNSLVVYSGNASTSANYNWDFDGGNTNMVQPYNPFNVFWTTSGTKTITLTVTENACSTTTANTVTVYDIPIVDIFNSDADSSVCEWTDISFTATPSGLANYDFYRNGVLIQSSSSDILNIFNITTSATFWVIGTDTNACASVESNHWPIQVSEAPVTTTSTPNNDTICEGDTITLTATPDTFDIYSYYDNFFDVIDTSVNSLSFTGAQNFHWYYIIPTDGGCTGTTNNIISFTVIDPLSTPQVNCGVTTDSSIQFMWDPINNALGYEISIDGGAFGPPSSGSLGLDHLITGLSINDSISIVVRALGDAPCGNSDLSNVVTCVAQNCKLVSYDRSADTSVCAGQTVDLTISNIQTPTSAFTITWESLAPAKDSLYTIIPFVSTVVDVEVIDSSQLNCPSVKKSITVDVLPTPDVAILSSDDSLCLGDSIVLSATGGAYENFTFWVNGVLLQDSVYPFLTLYDLATSGNNTVIVQATDLGCDDFDTLIFYVESVTPVVLSTSPSDIICQGDTITFSAQSGLAQYDFYLNTVLQQSSGSNSYSSTLISNQDDIYVLAADVSGCPAQQSNTKSITVNPIPVATLISSDPDNTICEGETILFDANPDTFDLYDFYDNFFNAQSGTVSLYQTSTLKDAHSMTVYVEEKGCRSLVSNSIVTTVIDSLETPIPVCGTTDNSSIEFVWDPIAGATGYVVSVNGGSFITPSSGGLGLSHSVTGLTTGDTVTIVVKALGNAPCGDSQESFPVSCVAIPCQIVDFDINPSVTTEICSGDTITLSISNVVTPTSSYSINWGNGLIGKTTSINVNPTKDTLVTVIVLDSSQLSCTPATKYFNIEVNSIPVVVLTASNDTMCETDSIVFTASPTYFDQYEFFDGFLSLQTGLNPEYIGGGIKDGHSITVYATNNGCVSASSNPIKMTVIAELERPAINCGYSNTDSIQFVWDPVPGATAYEISIDGAGYITPSSGALGLEHLITGLNPNDTLIAKIIALGDAPCGNSIESFTTTCATIKCNAINFTKSSNPDVCEGDPTTLSISDIVYPGVPYAVIWDGITHTNELTQIVSALNDTLVTVMIIDSSQAQCFPVTKYYDIDIHSYPKADLSHSLSTDSLCEGNPITFSLAQAGYDQYEFYVNGQLAQDSTYHKYTTGSLPLGNNTIYADVTDYGCLTQSTTYAIRNISYPLLTVDSSDPNDSICIGDAILITASSGFDNYTFYYSSTLLQSSSGNTINLDTLTVPAPIWTSASNENFCFRNDTLLTQVFAIPSFNLTTNIVNDTACSLDSVKLFASPGSYQKYWFYDNGVLVQNSSDSSLSLFAEIRTYLLTVISNNYGCADTSSDTITVNYVYQSPTVTAGFDSAGICVGETLTLTASTSGNGTYLWSTGETVNTIVVQPPSSVIYTVTVTENNCMSLADSIVVAVDEVLVTSADAGADVVICRGETTTLNASGGLNYIWNYNVTTLSDTAIANPIATPVDTTTYLVTVSNVYCSATDSVVVLVDPCLDDLSGPIPSVYTPNGDGDNDFWIIPDIGYFRNNEVFVYNRWGNIVFQAAPYQNTWDGTNKKDNDLADGTYYYLVNLGNGITYSGFIMIHR